MAAQQFKSLIVSIICHPVIGKLVSFIHNDRFSRNGIHYVLNSPWISNRIKALIFWNIYEKAEISFVKKYLSEKYPVIELGGSLGIVSAIIGKKIGEQSLITVEANPNLISIIEKHLRINKGGGYEIIHAGIADEAELFFHKGNDNSVGRVSHICDHMAIPIPVRSLENLLREKNIEFYSLVSDIEGAEVSYIFSNQDALAGCKQLIIELHMSSHNGILISVDQQIQQLKSIGFKIIAKHGPVIFAEK